MSVVAPGVDSAVEFFEAIGLGTGATVVRPDALGGTPLRSIARCEDACLRCYLRGPDGVVVAPAQDL